MKKLFLLLLFSIGAAAQTSLVSLTASAPATSITNNEQTSGTLYHQIIWRPTGTVSSCSVKVDSSTDGTTWNNGDVIAAQTCTSAGVTTLTTAAAYAFVRINATSLSGGGSVYFTYQGFNANPGGGTSTPSDAFTNPTTAQASFALSGLWNGSQWVRQRDIAGSASSVVSGVASVNPTYYNVLQGGISVPASNGLPDGTAANGLGDIRIFGWNSSNATSDPLRTSKSDNGVKTGQLEVSLAYSFFEASASTTGTAVKATAGILHSITVNTSVANATIRILNLASAGCTSSPTSPTIALITLPATVGNPFTLVYDITASAGICIVASGATEETIAFQ